MRISDWSSDVCSSDLADQGRRVDAYFKRQFLLWDGRAKPRCQDYDCSQRRGKPEIGNDHACCLHPCAPHRLHGVGQVEEGRVSGHEVPIAEAMIALSIIWRSEEHTSELQSLMRISYAVFCLKQQTTQTT